MPGKLCFGVEVGNAGNLKESKTYCEGRLAAFRGQGLFTNPFPIGTVGRTRWAAGHNAFTGGAPKGCSAV